MSATDFCDSHQAIHIPARDLTGTREAKLAELDTFIAQLQVVRLALCGHVVRLDGLNNAGGQHLHVRERLRSWAATRLRAFLRLTARHATRSNRSRT